jgi:Uma2 family endonuclease
MSTAPKRRYSVGEYMAIEAASTWKHEYYHGEIFAMAGSSPNHAKITVNISSSLNQQLSGKPCQVFSNDLRIKTKSNYVYADATVVCEEPIYDMQILESLTNPKLIVEVLSPSTEDHDREGKFEEYKLIDSFTDYLLASQNEPLLELHSRGKDGRWTKQIVRGLDESLGISSIGCRLKLREVYDRVVFPPSKRDGNFPVIRDDAE